MDESQINSHQAEAAEHLLGYYGHAGGTPPGGFTSQLITLWEKADLNNRVRLSIGFPGMSWAVGVIGQPGGSEVLQRLLAEYKASK